MSFKNKPQHIYHKICIDCIYYIIYNSSIFINSSRSMVIAPPKNLHVVFAAVALPTTSLEYIVFFINVTANLHCTVSSQFSYFIQNAICPTGADIKALLTHLWHCASFPHIHAICPTYHGKNGVLLSCYKPLGAASKAFKFICALRISGLATRSFP